MENEPTAEEMQEALNALADALSDAPEIGHIMQRTSAKGDRFIGECLKCGFVGTAEQANDPCPPPGTKVH